MLIDFVDDLGDGQRLSAVVVPLVSREIEELDVLFFFLWGLWGLAGEGGSQEAEKLRLILSFDVGRQPEIEAGVAEAFEHYHLDRVFSDHALHFCEIAEAENIYVRHGQAAPATLPRLGLTSGPNTQFFRTLEPLCAQESTILLNEVDCFPVREDWVRRLKRVVAGSEPFWVLGSPYWGAGRLGPQFIQHVNGNAFYCVGDPGFPEFLRDWESSLEEEVKRNPFLAYDIFPAYRHSALFDPARWGNAPAELFGSLPVNLCRIRYTPSIHNLAGEEEISGRHQVDLRAYRGRHPDLVLVHGRFLWPQVLQGALDDIDRLVRAGRVEAGEVRDYLVDAAQRLLDRGSVAAAKAIMERVSASERAQPLLGAVEEGPTAATPYGEQRTVFAFSIHKAGSTLFYQLLKKLMEHAGRLRLPNALRFVSIPDALVADGVPEQVLEQADFLGGIDRPVDEADTLYGGFRFVPAFATDDFLDRKRVMVLIRDPRDVLTSLYFSMTRSHRIPPGEAGARLTRERERARVESIDDFVLRQARAGSWRQRFARLTELKGRGAAWRYEDVVFEKRRWVDEILDYLQIDLPEALRDEIAQSADAHPDAEDAEDAEDADKHIREVTPSDHRRKLRPETIDLLSDLFRDTLDAWGYE